MEDRQHATLPEVDEHIALVFQGQPYAPDLDPNTKQMVMSLSTFKGVFKGVVMENPPRQKTDNGSEYCWPLVPIWLIGDPGGSIIWRVKRDQVLMWTSMPSLNRA